MALDNFLNRSVDLYKFHPDTSIPDLAGKVIIVTGGNAGLGHESVLQLAQHGPKRIYLTARSKAKYDTAMSDIRQKIASADNIIQFVEMDLASFASVKTAADYILGDADRLDVLMNNAGIMGAAPGLTNEGYEIHFGTNHMGHALFTKLLMPLLLKTAEVHSVDVRVVNVSSGAYQFADSQKGIDLEAIKTDMSGAAMMQQYGPSKLANVLHAKALATRYPTVTSIAIAPGRVKTALLDGMYSRGQNKAYGYFQKFYDVVVGAKPVDAGAYTQVWAATEPSKDRVENGGMYFPVGKKDGGTKFSNDTALADKLWEFTETELKRHGY